MLNGTKEKGYKFKQQIMAKEIRGYYDELVAEKNSMSTLNAHQPNIDSAQQLLADIATPSKVADWRLWLWIAAFCTWLSETRWDRFKKETDEKIANNQYGSPPWWRVEVLKFQHGHELTYLNNKFQYAVIDPAVQIIKRAAIIESEGVVIIKVAKLAGNVPTVLTAQELTSFDAFVNKIRPSGVATTTVSRNADKLKVIGSIRYDAIIPLADVKASVEAAIEAYITNLPFNGEFTLVALVDAIQKAKGVLIPTLTSVEAKYGAIPYAVITERYIADAGYMTIDPDFLLANTLAYVANV